MSEVQQVNHNGQIMQANRGKSEVKASFTQGSMGQANDSTVGGSQTGAQSMLDNRSMTQEGFAQLDRGVIRSQAVGARKTSKSAVREKRYGNGKRSQRGIA